MATYYQPTRRVEHYIDGEGVVVWTKFKDEIDDYVWDLTDALASGESVSSVATDVSGVTLNTGTLSSPTYTMTVTGTNGTIRAKATLSTGRVLHGAFKWLDRHDGRVRNDYRYST